MADYLRRRFPDPPLVLSPDRYLDLVGDLAQRHIVGGRVYDALIGLIAAEHHATLISLDRRAVVVYDAVGAVVEQPA